MTNLERRLKTGHLVIPFEGKALTQCRSNWDGYEDGFVRIIPGGFVGPKPIATILDEIHNFKFREQDVVVMTYPKCGTTWMQELVWTMKHNPNLNNQYARTPINVRSPALELDSFNKTDGKMPPKPENQSFPMKIVAILIKMLILVLYPVLVRMQIHLVRHCPRLIETGLRTLLLFDPASLSKFQLSVAKLYPKESHLFLNHVITNCFNTSKPIPGLLLRACEYSEGPRIIRTHLPFTLLPEDILDKCKVIFVMRNPKDMLVSFYYYCRLFNLHRFKGTFEAFMQTFLDGDMLYGNYHLNLKDAFERNGHPNLLIVHYEELKRESINEIKKIDSFLGTALSDDQINKIAKYTSFKEMKSRDNVAGPSIPGTAQNALYDSNVAKQQGGFFRKGEVGEWQTVMSEEMEKRLDEWVLRNCSQHGIRFVY